MKRRKVPKSARPLSWGALGVPEAMQANRRNTTLYVFPAVLPETETGVVHELSDPFRAVFDKLFPSSQAKRVLYMFTRQTPRDMLFPAEVRTNRSVLVSRAEARMKRETKMMREMAERPGERDWR